MRHFEPVNWGGNESKTDEDIAYQIPDMPELDEDHGLKKIGRASCRERVYLCV